MLIPSIDLMGGRVVQLVHGEDLALGFDDLGYWIERFSDYPLVQLIDLDAAKRQGDNRRLIETIVHRLPCQVGGGIRSSAEAQILLDMGAQRVIFGSSLFNGRAIGRDHRARKLYRRRQPCPHAIRRRARLFSRRGTTCFQCRYQRQQSRCSRMERKNRTAAPGCDAAVGTVLWRLPLYPRGYRRHALRVSHGRCAQSSQTNTASADCCRWHSRAKRN